MARPRQKAAEQRNTRPGGEALAGARREVVRVRLLGGFSVSIGSRNVSEDEWRLKKAASLVKLLALAPHHQLHREQAMDHLWSGLDEKARANNLRGALHVARRTLEPAVDTASCSLGLRGEEIVLCPDGPLWVDAEAFEEAAEAARRTHEPAAYRAALDLYAGDLLPRDRYEAWVEDRREGLRQLYLALLSELGGLYEERGAFEAAVEVLGRVVEAEPSHEEAHVGLMRLYSKSGRRHEVLLQYERLRKALSEELGIEPGEAGRRLYEEVLAGRSRERARPEARDAPVASPRQSRRHNLPAERTSFVGREREVVEVERLLSMTRLLTLTGAGGSGKTRFALAVAKNLVGTYRDGAWLVELAPLSDPALVEQAVAQALGVREQPGRPLSVALKDHLSSKKLLLVLDNCEHVIEAVARLVETLLDDCPGLRVLATSREALNVAGELVWRVPSLSVPGPDRLPAVDNLAGYESVRLFVERARYRNPAFVLATENAGAVIEICRKLDGMPLAIELAAARVRALSVEQIATRLEDSLRLLTGSRTAEPRQRTLTGALDWSYELLSEPEKKLFGRLSVFVGGWTLEAAEAVGEDVEEDEVLELLLSLVDKSLVVAEASGEEGELRYGMLEPVRQYGLERLEESGDAGVIRCRHAGWFLALAEEAEPELYGPDQATWLGRLEMERDNLWAAIGWSLGEEPEMGLRFAGALSWFCYLRGYYGEGHEWLEEAPARAGAAPAPFRAKALLGVGLLVFVQCQYERATALLQESATLYREMGDKRGVASALEFLGSVAREQGRYARAKALHEESLTLRRQSGDEAGGADSLVYLGFVAWLQADYERAEALCTESLAVCRRLGNTHGTIWSLIILGAVAHQGGDYERGAELLQESLALSREGYMDGAPFSLNQLGVAAYRRGEHEQAAALLKESLVLHRDLGDRWRIASVLEGLAELTCARGKHERATKLFGAGEALRKTIGTPLPTCERADYESGVAAARAVLDERTFAAAWAEGRSMALEQVVQYALSGEEDQPITAPVSEESPVDRSPAALSRREREVAILAARELTNRQIAQELVLSEHTVATHVRKILKKLGLRSRTQISAWAIEQQLLP